MRTKDRLNAFEDVKVLQQYLYMSEDHSIEYVNIAGCALSICMDEDLRVWSRSASFPDAPAMNISSDFTPAFCMDLVEYLREVPAKEFPDRFKNRWEEIHTICCANAWLNRPNK